MTWLTTIKIETADWLYNAGIAGMINILREAGFYPNCKNGLEIDSSILADFSSYYFQYFERRYIDHVSYTYIEKKGQAFIELDINDWNEKMLDDWNRYIERTKKYLKSNSYQAAYEIMPNKDVNVLEIEKQLSKITLKKKQDISDIYEDVKKNMELLTALLLFFRLPDVKKYIVAKNVIYTVIDNFWGGVSFLHKSSSKNDMEVEFQSYFVQPVQQYHQEMHAKDKYSCFVCNNSISKPSKPFSFDLAWLNKMGVDMSRKSSHFWDLNTSASNICPICNLVYACVPAGFTVLKGQGYFVNCNSDINQLVKLNNNSEEVTIPDDETIQMLELRSYYQILEVMKEVQTKQQGREIQNIQVVKYSRSDSRVDKMRPYTFNVLSKDKLSVIKKHQEPLRNLVNKIVKLHDDSYLNIYQSVLERLYKNKNQFDLIAMLCRSNLAAGSETQMRGIGFIRTLIFLNNSFLGTLKKGEGDDSMSGYSSWVHRDTIKKIEKAGRALTRAYTSRNAANKLSGITYRLLNALKTKDAGRFMDTFAQAHLYAGIIMPTEIIDVLQDEEKLQTLGYAFIIGLRSVGEEKNGEEKYDE